MRRKIKLMNLLIISYGKSHPFIGLELNAANRNFSFEDDKSYEEEDIYEKNKDEFEIREEDIIDSKSKVFEVIEEKRKDASLIELAQVDAIKETINEDNEILQRRSLIMKALEKRLIPLESDFFICI